MPRNYYEYGTSPRKYDMDYVEIKKNKKNKNNKQQAKKVEKNVKTQVEKKKKAVKNAYVDAQGKCTCPKDLPYCVCGAVSEGKIINKKPIIATKEEQEENSRSKSAKLRVFEKI